MSAKFLTAARVIAWTVAIGAVGAVIVGYDSLPTEIPVTRWTVAPRSPFLALRVPLINLMTIGLIELLALGLRRAKEFHRADTVFAVVFLTAAAKAGLEAAGILMLPLPFSWTLMPLVMVLVVGLGTAAFLARDFLHPQRWAALRMTKLEMAGALALVTGIAVLNLPLFMR